jgi:SAM-dependent methyltransferase
MEPTSECYNAPPLETVDGIPVFSRRDFYVENYERISNDHLSHQKKTGRNPFMDEEHWAEIDDSTAVLIRRHSASGARVLDVGVGMGRLLGRFPDLERYGMDISLPYLQEARAQGIQVCMARIEDMPYKPGFFDTVVSTDVLEHVLDLNLAFARILSALKPDGILIVRVPYRENLSGYLNPDYPYELVHVRSFDEHSIRLFVEKIFNRQLLDYSFTGFNLGPLKWPAVPPGTRRLVRNAIEFSKRFEKERPVRLAKLCNRPIEINFIVKNTPAKNRSGEMPEAPRA